MAESKLLYNHLTGLTGYQSVGLTEEENKVLHHLAEAWNTFVALGNKHPDANDEFRHKIHDLQYMIAGRVAARVNPEIWNQYPEASPQEDKLEMDNP